MAPTLAIIFFKKIFIGCAGPLLLHRLSLVVVSRGYSLLQCVGFSLRWSLLSWCTGSRSKGFSRCSSWALQHGLNSCGAWAYCSPAYGTFLDQRWKPCLLHCQADSLPLSHQGSHWPSSWWNLMKESALNLPHKPFPNSWLNDSLWVGHLFYFKPLFWRIICYKEIYNYHYLFAHI